MGLKVVSVVYTHFDSSKMTRIGQEMHFKATVEVVVGFP